MCLTRVPAYARMKKRKTRKRQTLGKQLIERLPPPEGQKHVTTAMGAAVPAGSYRDGR